MNLEDAWRLIHSGYRIKITALTSKGRRRNIHTVIGEPGNWLPYDDHIARAAVPKNPLDWRRLGLAIDRMMESAIADVGQFEDGRAPLDEDIPWPVLSIVCDVVHEAGQRAVSVEQLKSVARQHGKRILALETLPVDRRQHAVECLRQTISSAVGYR
ncbi:hypothetical protein [Mycobacterium paragordonae]|uniref:hypothetical protein n=1 Tax=Mycobacterium paragordonae TaxID=1389713 RepID=UPI0012E2A156|nr:hypothetical protein [Mycobacterium paragordonae]